MARGGARGRARASRSRRQSARPCATGTCGTSGPGAWLAPGTGSLATHSQTSSTLTINQQSQQAILNWSSFNIAAGSGVRFNQPSTSSIALNQIYDNNPSTIFGNLSANGQVFLINQNGFLFGKSATVNVNTLVASSLGLANQTFLDGILNSALLTDRAPAFASDGRTSVTDQNGKPRSGRQRKADPGDGDGRAGRPDCERERDASCCSVNKSPMRARSPVLPDR